MKKSSNKNPLLIGIILIMAIFLITFMRSSYSNKQNQQASEDSKNKLEDEISENIKKADKISAVDLEKKISSRQDLNLVDIREKSDFDIEHLPDSTNLPLSEIKDSIGVLDKRKNYTLIDSDSSLMTTAYAVKVFTEAGFKNISYLDGGFSGWKDNYYQTISIGNPQSFVDQSKVNYINSDKLKQILATEKNVTVIDVRKSDEYRSGHIRSAINIFAGDIESKKSEIAFRKKIVLYDNDGISAFQTAVRLFDLGIFNVYALSDKFDVWQSKNYETEK